MSIKIKQVAQKLKDPNWYICDKCHIDGGHKFVEHGEPFVWIWWKKTNKENYKYICDKCDSKQ